MVILGVVLTIAASTLPIPGMGRETMFYEPYPVLRLPGFSLWMGISLLALLIPGLLALSNNAKQGRFSEVEKAGG